ncbi:hypothetical protein CS542_07810 [Pedobacter sp. IW39]|nr:hypothetical protein CS542_07810 [Pedobacter sp. IW39]
MIWIKAVRPTTPPGQDSVQTQHAPKQDSVKHICFGTSNGWFRYKSRTGFSASLIQQKIDSLHLPYKGN